jgi:predicted phage terminase large subunit-like protein
VIDVHGEAVFGVKLSDEKATANSWEVQGHMGGMETVGRGGALTGKGADLLLIDDPVKGREEALSMTIQDQLYDWYKSDVYTRLEPGASVVIVATRWSTEDLIGRLITDMEMGGEDWEVLALPAFAEENDVLGRAEDEALWPERYDVEALTRIKKVLGTHWWNAEYQQRPAPVAGDMIKIDWFRRYRERPMEPQQIILSFDTAQKEKELNDYTVCGVWYVYDNKYYLIDVMRERMDHPRLLATAKNLYAMWKPHVILIEDKASGTSLIQHLDNEVSAPIIPVTPTTDKITRMAVESPIIEAGRVYLPEAGSQPWLYTFEEEIRAFPNSARKDQVDMLSQFLGWARERTNRIEIF